MKRILPIAAALALLGAHATNSCSYEEFPALHFEVRPDPPERAFVAGALGILQPGYAESHLVVAYRWLAGPKPTSAEQEGFRALIDFRLGESQPKESPVTAWIEARNDLPSIPQLARVDTYRLAGNFENYENCLEPAFASAVATLQDRIAKFGEASPAVASWVAAQDVVFDNCSGSNATPEPAAASLPPLIRADRAYQIASAAFYAGDYDRAHELFRAIGRDRTSPWRDYGAYLGARALMRKASLVTGNEDRDEAERELRAIVADATLRRVAGPADDLLARIAAEKDANARIDTLARQLARGTETNPRRDLGDYTWLRERSPDHKSTDDLSDWIDTLHALNTPEAHADAHAVERWNATHSLPWLVAVMDSEDADTPQSAIDAVRALRPDSPAFVTLRYHLARMRIADGKPDEAVPLLDELLAIKSLPVSARNQLRAERLPLARSLGAFLRDLPRAAIGVNEFTAFENAGTTAERFGTLIDDGGAAIVNRVLPLDAVVEASRDETMPRDLRNRFTAAAWTRAVLLGRHDVADSLTASLAKAYPETARAMKRYAASAGGDRAYAALDAIVHTPGLTPYLAGGRNRFGLGNQPTTATDLIHLHDNWWCFDATSYWTTPPLPAAPPAPPFAADPATRQRADAERAQLLRIGSGASYILRAAIEASDRHPTDVRAAEDLALAIAGTRWACPDTDTPALAKRAFNLLHSRYPDTKWAKQTKYWYTGKD